MDSVSEHLSWMAWTWQTGLFFGTIALLLAVMTLLAVYRPESPRVGILRFATTRGDRLFVSLLSAAFIYLFFIKLGVDNGLYPAITSLLLAAVLFRFA